MKKTVMLVIICLLVGLSVVNAIEIDTNKREQKHAPLLNEKTNSLFSTDNEIYNYQDIETKLFSSNQTIYETDVIDTNIVFNNQGNWYTPYVGEAKESKTNILIIGMIVILLVMVTYLLTIKRYKHGNKNSSKR